MERGTGSGSIRNATLIRGVEVQASTGSRTKEAQASGPDTMERGIGDGETIPEQMSRALQATGGKIKEVLREHPQQLHGKLMLI